MMLDTVNFTTYRLKRKTPINVSNNMTDNDNTGIFHVFEMRFGMDEFDHRILALLSSSKKGLKNSGLNGDSNPDLCDADITEVGFASSFRPEQGCCSAKMRLTNSFNISACLKILKTSNVGQNSSSSNVGQYINHSVLQVKHSSA